MSSNEQFHRINATLRSKGFRLDPFDISASKWKGLLKVAVGSIPVTFQVPDLHLTRLPKIFLQSLDDLPRRNHPHIDPETLQLCYADETRIVLDRYIPGESVIACLERAEHALNDIINGKLDEDFPDEFVAYWQGDIVYTDLPPGFSGTAKLHFISIQNDAMPRLFCTNRKTITPWHESRLRTNDGMTPSSGSIKIIPVSGNMTVPKTGEWPPVSLSGVVNWLNTNSKELSKEFQEELFSLRKTHRLVGFRAANGLFIVGIDVPKEWRTKEFLENRPGSLNRMLMKQRDKIDATRYFGYRMDQKFVYQRNLGSLKSLRDISVLLIGAGTIGGFLAQLLVQSGAGSQKHKPLTIVDNDVFAVPNVGRHLLGMPYVGMNKATACQEYLLDQHPEAFIRAISEPILDGLWALKRCDLVIDATGEESLSYALNHELLAIGEAAPPVIFSWLEGNGTVGRSFFFKTGDGPCYRCLHPNLANQERYPVLHHGADFETVETLSCGDAAHVPFPSSRSMQAAGMTLDMVLDWVNGNPKPLLRNRPYDMNNAIKRPDANPSISDKCPACSAT